MRVVNLLFFILVTQICYGADTERSVLVSDDGIISGSFPVEGAMHQVRFDFGLPRVAPSRKWQEGEAVRTLWITNGIRYTQSLIITQYGPESLAKAPVLLVSIEGENTNSDYAEAFADLTLEIDGKRPELELKQGILQLLHDTGPVMVAGLEIPESGIRTSKGAALHFSGNIPPSLKGSMTLKVPLALLSPGLQANALADLEFDAEFRRVRKVPLPLGPRIQRAPGAAPPEIGPR